jgi:hypothetical protein
MALTFPLQLQSLSPSLQMIRFQNRLRNQTQTQDSPRAKKAYPIPKRSSVYQFKMRSRSKERMRKPRVLLG